MSATDDLETSHTSIHFMNGDDIVVDVSQAIFEDFHRLITSDLSYEEIVNGLFETCNDGVTSIRKLSSGIRKPNVNLRNILEQLCGERDAYALILSLIQNEFIALQKPESTLVKLISEDNEFRRLHALLRWIEKRSSDQNKGYCSYLANEDDADIEDMSRELLVWSRSNDLGLLFLKDNSRSTRSEESLMRFLKIVLAYIRTGRLLEAVELSNRCGFYDFAALIDSRNALFDQNLSSFDGEEAELPTTRITFKNVARSLLNKGFDDDPISSTCFAIWAALAGNLTPLLNSATCIDDRLWSYLTCAVDSIFDKAAATHITRRFLTIENIKSNVDEIFRTVIDADDNIFFRLYGYLAVDNPMGIGEIIQTELATGDIPAHAIRFYTHLALLLKKVGKNFGSEVVDSLVCRFVDVLATLEQFTLAPFYLSNASELVAKGRLVKLLRGIETELTRKEVLLRAVECGFDSNILCLSVYNEIKEAYNQTLDRDEQEKTKMMIELMRGWQWLTYNRSGTIYESLYEVNYIVRNMISLGRKAEAVELLQLSADSPCVDADDIFYEENGQNAVKPEQLIVAQREYQGYSDYFDAIHSFNAYVDHIEKPRPKLPPSLTDENWARLDIRKRAEYELSAQEARESRQRYDKLGESLRSTAIQMLETVLKSVEQWLPTGDDPTAATGREKELFAIRDDYVFSALHALVTIRKRSGDHVGVLNVARLIVDPKYRISECLLKQQLRRILQLIAKSGAAVVEQT